MKINRNIVMAASASMIMAASTTVFAFESENIDLGIKKMSASESQEAMDSINAAEIEIELLKKKLEREEIIKKIEVAKKEAREAREIESKPVVQQPAIHNQGPIDNALGLIAPQQAETPVVAAPVEDKNEFMLVATYGFKDKLTAVIIHDGFEYEVKQGDIIGDGAKVKAINANSGTVTINHSGRDHVVRIASRADIVRASASASEESRASPGL